MRPFRRPVYAAITVLLTAMLAAGCGGGTETSAIPSGGEARTPAGSGTAQADADAAPAGCREVPEPEPRQEGDLTKPKADLDPDRTWIATVETNCGTFAITLDLDAAPNAAASIAQLARRDFYDGTVFHRIVPGFVIQGGDPTGTGSGGPGYSTVDKPPRGAKYTRGVVAMAKAGAEAPGTAGSQFFVVTGADAGLPPDYAVVGKVTKGLDVVRRIGELGDSSEQPTFTVVIEDLRVSGS